MASYGFAEFFFKPSDVMCLLHGNSASNRRTNVAPVCGILFSSSFGSHFAPLQATTRRNSTGIYCGMIAGCDSNQNSR